MRVWQGFRKLLLRRQWWARLFVFAAMVPAAQVASADAANAAVDKDGWKLEKQNDAVKVWLRKLPDSDYRAFRGETVLNAEINQVMALLDDTPGFDQWMHDVQKPALVSKASLLQRQIYFVYDMPWPVTDRDVAVDVGIHQNQKSRQVTVSMKSLPVDSLDGQYQTGQNGLQAMESMRGKFILKPLEDDRTSVRFEMHIQPGGKLAPGLFNSRVAEMPYNTLIKMQTAVAGEKYRSFKPF